MIIASLYKYRILWLRNDLDAKVYSWIMIIIHIPLNRPVYLFGCICQKCVKILLFHPPTSIFHLNIILNSTTQNGFKIDSTTKSAWSYTFPLRLRIDLLLSFSPGYSH